MSVIFENVDKIVNASGVGIDFAQGVGGGSSKEFVATGNIGQGQTVGLKADGTVEVIKEVPTSVTQNQDIGSSVIFDIEDIRTPSSVYDPVNKRVVIAYRDHSNSGYGTVRVGEVSGNTITFGNEFIFSSASTYYPVTVFDSNSAKVVILYRDANLSGRGTAIVGTVSGNSISFGSPVVFNSGASSELSAAFDSNQNKIIVSYADYNNSDFGTASVGDVSGNSISFGSKTVFANRYARYTSTVFDPSVNKVVIAYSDQGNSGYGTAVVGEASNNSISFGSPVVFENAGGVSYISTVFDPSANKVVIAYMDESNSFRGMAIVGTVSGTSISFGSKVQFESGKTFNITTVFDSNLNKVIIAYADDGNSWKGTTVVGTVSGNSINFTTPVVFETATALENSITFDSVENKTIIAFRDDGNVTGRTRGHAVVLAHAGTATKLIYNTSSWLGIADEAITSGDSGKINLIGSVDSHQTGLTTGNTYYVNYDGTLTDTPNEGVENGTYGKIGKALSSTSLLLSK